MSHLVIWSTYRSGSHMLRSMLRADPGVHDAGQFLDRGDGFRREKEATAPRYLRDFMAAAEAEHPGKIIVTNPKIGKKRDLDAYAADMKAAGAAIIVLRRRDLLAQRASEVFARECNAWGDKTAPAGSKIFLSPKDLERIEITKDRLAHALALLDGVSYETIHYEDISVASVTAACRALGLGIIPGEPTTTKSAPDDLASFVVNYASVLRAI